MKIAVDAMGGDHAPDAILKGVAAAAERLEQGQVICVVGDAPTIEESLHEYGAGAALTDGRITVEHATEVIEMHDSPAKAVRSKPDSSIVKMCHLGSHKTDEANRADVVLSAGNTGACVSAAIMHMKRIRGVHRPGIAVTIPAFQNNVVLCDAGANPEPKPSHLWQYAVMSEVYCRRMLNIESPRVAMMNIGSEEGKGSELIRQTRDLIKETPGINFTGYVEGRDFFEGAADVVITDGFVGNTVLKMAEGMAKSLFKAIAHEILETNPALAVEFEPVVKQIWAKNDYHETGGAPLLGVNGACMIAHGSSEARTIAAAIRNSLKFAELGINEEIERRLEETAHIGEAAATA